MSCKLSFVLFMLLALLIALPAVAGAAPPERFSEEVEFGPMVVADCGGFELLYAGTAQYDYTLFYDNSGELTRVLYYHSGVDHFINANTGEELSGSYTHMAHDDLEGSFRETGLLWSITLPGSGITYFAAGQYTIDYDEAGNILNVDLDGVEVYDVPALCAELAA